MAMLKKLVMKQKPLVIMLNLLALLLKRIVIKQRPLARRMKKSELMLNLLA